jgi:hypothetical protein
MSQPPGQPSEEELRAALEEELRRLSVADVLLQTAVTLINLAGRRAGLAPGSEDERDLDQVREAIQGVRALMPMLEARHGEQVAPLKDALAQLQLAYARGVEAEGEGAAAPGAAQGPARPGEPGAAQPPGKDGPDEPGPAESSGRLWVPGR